MLIYFFFLGYLFFFWFLFGILVYFDFLLYIFDGYWIYYPNHYNVSLTLLYYLHYLTLLFFILHFIFSLYTLYLYYYINVTIILILNILFKHFLLINPLLSKQKISYLLSEFDTIGINLILLFNKILTVKSSLTHKFAFCWVKFQLCLKFQFTYIYLTCFRENSHTKHFLHTILHIFTKLYTICFGHKPHKFSLTLFAKLSDTSVKLTQSCAFWETSIQSVYPSKI